ncbi:aldo/keto reductase [Rugosimonospora acidiphila]|uniref:Aldo/keto reductase n=1 Tax=Rugosimonospora acidiphila TaxID=556531 RepID=A0ABP9SVZ2_9ACTN
MTAVIPALTMPSSQQLPVLGHGTWYLGERSNTRSEEIAALRLGLDLGMTMIDTAEMYGDGAAEELVGEAIAGRRDRVFLVDKVLPDNASARGTIQACQRSLRRLRTDHIDLYLLHWRGGYPLAETIEGFSRLIDSGEIGQWGVSNFDADDLDELLRTDGGKSCAANQILYNLTRRGPEFDLLPACRLANIPVIAYSPIEQGRLLDNPEITAVASRHDVTPAQVALAWVLRREGVAAIPRSGNPGHVAENAACLDVHLDDEDLARLDAAYPPPTAARPLEML